MDNNETQNDNESLMLAYINEIYKRYKSSTLWCIHSQLQTVLRIKTVIHFASYRKLHAFATGATHVMNLKRF